MNIPDDGGGEVPVVVQIDPGQTSTVTVFSDLSPDAYAVWPVITVVGVCLAAALVLLVWATLRLNP